MKRSFRIIALLVLYACKQVYSQGPWNLQQCIDHAQKNNVVIRQTLLNAELNNANLEQSKANALPGLNAFGTNQYNFGRTIDRYTNQFANQRTQSVNMGLSTQWTLFNGLQNYNLIKQNTSSYESVKFDTDKNRNDLSLNVASAYLQILLAGELKKTAENQTRITKEQLERTHKLVEAGALPKASELSVEAQLAGEELQVVNAANQEEMALLNLALLLDVKPEGFSIMVPQLPDPSAMPINFTREQVISAALASQPSLKSAEKRIESASYGIKVARGAVLPVLTFNGSWGTGYSGLSKQIAGMDSSVAMIGFTNSGESVYTIISSPTFEDVPFNNQLKDNNNKSLGISLSVPLFNNLQTHTNTIRARINYEQSKLQKKQTELDLVRSVSQAYADAIAALKKYNATLKSVEAQKESFQYMEQRFNVGASNSLDYNTQKNLLARAESDLLQSRFDYIFKLKVLEFYMGRPISL